MIEDLYRDLFVIIIDFYFTPVGDERPLLSSRYKPCRCGCRINHHNMIRERKKERKRREKIEEKKRGGKGGGRNKKGVFNNICNMFFLCCVWEKGEGGGGGVCNVSMKERERMFVNIIHI
eukprot:TRINITY_DN12705_c0_g1_i1.p2 TRINITY_DN12705_c0_g1~~TRINITY_DN12705_c0_g1_i1.p2  ORF type:complete len:120 (+),score=8.23 TRINITY_DN12705_c0_g1_i1:113-472(+)